jgi:hypothetical protein
VGKCHVHGGEYQNQQKHRQMGLLGNTLDKNTVAQGAQERDPKKDGIQRKHGYK